MEDQFTNLLEDICSKFEDVGYQYSEEIPPSTAYIFLKGGQNSDFKELLNKEYGKNSEKLKFYPLTLVSRHNEQFHIFPSIEGGKRKVGKMLNEAKNEGDTDKREKIIKKAERYGRVLEEFPTILKRLEEMRDYSIKIINGGKTK